MIHKLDLNKAIIKKSKGKNLIGQHDLTFHLSYNNLLSKFAVLSTFYYSGL